MTVQVPAVRVHPSISAVLPAYNEEAVIAETVRRTAASAHRTRHRRLRDSRHRRRQQGRDSGSRVERERRGPARPGGVAFAQPRLRSGAAHRVRRRNLRRGLPHGQRRSVRPHRDLPAPRPLRAATASSAGIASVARTRGRGASITGRSSVSCGSDSGRRCATSTAPSSFFREPSAGGSTLTVRWSRTELLVRARRSGYRLMNVGVHHYPRTTGRATGADVARGDARVPRALAAAQRPRDARRARPAGVRPAGDIVVMAQRAGGGRVVAAALARRLRRRAGHRLSRRRRC